MSPEGAVAIRRVEHGADLPSGSIAPDVFDADVSPDSLAAFLAAPGHALFVAVADGVIVGQARGMIHVQPDGPSQLYVDNLGVTPSHRRRGVASGLLRALTVWGRTCGCASMWVATETDNDEAIAFYAALGLAPKTLVWFEGELADEARDG